MRERILPVHAMNQFFEHADDFDHTVRMSFFIDEQDGWRTTAGKPRDGFHQVRATNHGVLVGVSQQRGTLEMGGTDRGLTDKEWGTLRRFVLNVWNRHGEVPSLLSVKRTANITRAGVGDIDEAIKSLRSRGVISDCTFHAMEQKREAKPDGVRVWRTPGFRGSVADSGDSDG